MSELLTLRQQIEALPEPDQSKRRAFYTDDEWMYSWELNARPFQIRPRGSDARIWTIIGGRRVGKSYAGEHYMIDNFVEEKKSALGIFYHAQSMQDAFNSLFQVTEMYSGEFRRGTMDGGGVKMLDLRNQQELWLMTEAQWKRGAARGTTWDFIWADEVGSAIDIVDQNRLTTEFLFTEPAPLHPKTLVSRAGDGRTY